MADLYEAIGKISNSRSIEERDDYFREAVLMLEEAMVTGLKVYAESHHLNLIKFGVTTATIRREDDADSIPQVIAIYYNHPLSHDVIRKALKLLKKQYEDLDVLVRIHPDMRTVSFN